MPSFACLHPTCTEYVQKRNTHCKEHQGNSTAVSSATYYDQHLRDPEAAKFYQSAAWARARGTKLANTPFCERCAEMGRATFAQHVHHKIPLKECTYEQKLAQDNLYSVCIPCHNAIEHEVRQAKPK